MGCWNATCILSNLPIHSGEKILAIPIAETHYPHNGNYSYPDSIYMPIMPPLYGRYDGYGSIEDCDSLTEEVVEWFFQTLKENDGLCGIDSDDSLHDMFGLMCRGDVYFRHNGSFKNLHTSVAFVRQDVFEALKKSTQKDELYCEIIQEAEALWEKIQSWPNVNTMEVSDAFSQLFRYLSHSPRCYMSQFQSSILWRGCDLKTIKGLLFDLISMNFMLLQLRQGYLPTGGAGSQETFTPMMKTVHATCLNIIDEHMRKSQEV